MATRPAKMIVSQTIAQEVLVPTVKKEPLLGTHLPAKTIA
jgi:hypothetical protein